MSARSSVLAHSLHVPDWLKSLSLRSFSQMFSQRLRVTSEGGPSVQIRRQVPIDTSCIALICKKCPIHSHTPSFKSRSDRQRVHLGCNGCEEPFSKLPRPCGNSKKGPITAKIQNLPRELLLGMIYFLERFILKEVGAQTQRDNITFQ